MERRCLDVAIDEEACVLRVTQAYFSDNRQLIRSVWQYDFRGSGELKIDAKVLVDKTNPSLPRVGAAIRLKDAPEALTWFGRGPHENYPDRKLSANVGRWRVPTGEMHTPYIFPSDNGLRCDVNELEVGQVRVSGDFHFAASRYGMKQLKNAQHDYELQKEAGLYLYIDGFHMGVGGDDSWSRSVKPEYRLVAGEYKWQFCLA